MLASRRYRHWLLCVLIAALCGCESDDGTGTTTRDSSTESWVTVGITPSYLATAVSPSSGVTVRATHNALTSADAEAAVRQAFRLERQDGTVIAGTWSTKGATSISLTYTPSGPLPSGEYLVRFIGDPRVRPRYAPHAFRVGSLPRVRAIAFAGSPADTLNIRFSESVNLDLVATSLVLTTGGQAVSLARQGTGSGENLSLKASAPFQMSDIYKIVIPVDVGAAAKLDSQYAGQEGTQPFERSLKPVDHSPDTPWEPAVTF